MIAEAAAAAPSRAGRDVGLDVARGLLMAYVVIVIHGTFWLRLIPQLQASFVLFEMPLIFIVSGAAYYHGQIAKAEDAGGALRNYGSYLLSRGVRILAPFWVYAIVAACIVVAVRHFDAGQTFRYWLDPYWTGGRYTYSFLSSHLWFVSPFLGVTALLPLLARLPAWTKAPLWLWAIVGVAIIFALDALRMPSLRIYQMIVFYGLWALFGFGLAATPRHFRTRDFAIVLVLALAALVAAFQLFPDHTILNMQKNKFPPNAMFFLFSCAWVAMFIIVARALKPEQIAALANFALLKPFIRSGYSIYLWQGLGYTAAFAAGVQLGWSVWLIWPVAVVLTVLLGMLASPVERLRLKRAKSAPAARRA